MKVYVTMDLCLDNVPISEWKDDNMTIINDLLENGTNNGYYAQDMIVELEDIRVNTIRVEGGRVMELMILKYGFCFLLGFWISSILDESEVKEARKNVKYVNMLKSKAYKNGYNAGVTSRDMRGE